MSILGGWTCGTCGKGNTPLRASCGRCGARKSAADDPGIKQFVATYATLRSAHDFRKEAQELARRGWRVVGQSSTPIGMGHNITQLTVTYVRE